MSDYENFEDDALSILDIVNEFKVLFFSNIKTIVFSGIAILFCSGLHLYNTPKQYVTYAKIKVLDEKETSAFVLEDMLDFSSGFKDKELLNNEIEIITSKNILEQVIKKLQLNHSYVKVGLVTNVSLPYDARPFSIEIASASDSSKDFDIDISVGQNTIANVNDEISSSFMFGKTFVLGLDTLKISKSTAFNSIEENGGKYLFKVSSSYSVFQSLKSKILLNPVTDMVLGVSTKGTDPGLNVQIIESLLQAYASDGINDNKLISEGTSEFLSDRISLIKSEIGIIESALSEIKKKNDFIDISSINALFSSQKIISNDMTFEIETQTLIANSFLDKLKSQSINELLPLPIEVGISNSELSSFTGDFNKLVLERSALLKGRTKDNPEIYILDDQLSNLLLNLQVSVKNYLANLNLKSKKILDYDRDLESQLYVLNDTELTIVKFARDLEVKSKILLFLLEKKEENALKLAVNAPTFKVLDSTYTNYKDATPNTRRILLTGLLLALILPFGFVYLKTILYDKITYKVGLEKLLNSDIPVVGEIPMVENTLISLSNTRGALMESFRLIRTNLNYFSKTEVILVTSSIQGEGKTFAAVNLAQSLCSVKNNKVLLLGLDLRNPKIHTLLNLDRKANQGITNYLVNDTIDLKTLVEKNDQVSFDYILSGPIPPNPTELLLSDNLKDIIEFGKQNYDYVIIDSAPCLLVSDTLNISKYTDTTVYMTKSKHTKIKLIDYINKLHEDKSLNNIAVVINGCESGGPLGYSYGYSYGYNYGYNYGYSANEDHSKK